MKILVSQLLILSIAFLSCNTNTPLKQQKDLYFNIIDILKYEIAALEKLNPTVIKKSTFDGQESNATLKNIKWNKEFESLKALDLNKPALQNEFKAVAVIRDSIIVTNYIRKKTSNTPIKYLRAIFTTSNKLKTVIAKTQKSNLIFNSETTYQLDFDTSTMLLNRYEVNGKQGFILMKSNTFSLNASIQK